MLPMNILDAEYQFDRHKLTYYFEADRRIDFRDLVSELFSLYKTRIWMQQVDTSAVGANDPGFELAKATGFAPKRVENSPRFSSISSPYYQTNSAMPHLQQFIPQPTQMQERMSLQHQNQLNCANRANMKAQTETSSGHYPQASKHFEVNNRHSYHGPNFTQWSEPPLYPYYAHSPNEIVDRKYGIIDERNYLGDLAPRTRSGQNGWPNNNGCSLNTKAPTSAFTSPNTGRLKQVSQPSSLTFEDSYQKYYGVPEKATVPANSQRTGNAPMSSGESILGLDPSKWDAFKYL
jgi:hypothetical protein